MTFDPPIPWSAWLHLARTKLPVCTPQQLQAYIARREAERNAGKGKS